MKNDTIKHYIIDSRKRTSGVSHNFTLEFRDSIKYANKTSLQLVSIPVTYYNVKDGYNKINFNEGGPELIATLDSGNYSIADLLVEIKAKMEAVGALTYTVTYSNITMKLTISASGSFELLYGTGSNPTDQLRTLLGYDAVDTGSATSHVSNDVVRLSNPRFIKIRIREFGISGKFSDDESFTFIINVEENRGAYNNNKLGEYYQQCTISCDTITDIQVQLFDEDNNLLDMNGGEWYAVLKIQ